MKRLIGLCALSLCALTSVNSYATPLDAATNQALSEYLTHQNKYGRFSGNVIIAKKNEILFEQAVGYADVQMQRPIEKNNLFKVGDITKQLTAAAILKLNEQKKLSIDTPISRYFPSLSRSKNITIGMLMNHTAKIGRDFNWNDATQSCSKKIGQTDFYTHSGHIDGFKSTLMYEHKSQMTIVALSNIYINSK
ncbi:serine hydrolase domain-containing protein [Photobacterium damselae]|uniref:serine hydrolase domain-containing protein n=1 Tax=Photobacterium damselae TaxID=38293 RepID=UPI0018A50113|nr:serine hydrolase domain-containing protein [Photobacterium damselae]QOQ70970.1 beta-lactamase family protein [Photobacterium damselae subsp. damselae]